MKKEKGLKGVRGYKPTTFEDSFKTVVAREYIEGMQSFNQLAKKHGLPSGDTVRYFVRWYKQWLDRQSIAVPGSATVTNNNAIETELQLQQANLRITALEMLIQNAEKELGIDITKKFGTKQQGK
jgi:transposase-like protein